MSTTAQAGFSFVEQLARDLKDDRLELPAFPDAVLRIQSALQSPDTDANEIVAILSSDPALAARILRTANSVAFKRADKEITDLRTAVTRMGFNMVRTIAVAFAMRQLRQRDLYSAEARDEIESIWRDSLQIATICYVIAKHYTRLNADQALLTGLLHGLGRLYIVMRAEEIDAAVDLREVTSGWQASIGKAILDSWGLPETLQHAVEHQDELTTAMEGETSLTDVLISAKVLSSEDAEAEVQTCPAVRRVKAVKEKDVTAVLADYEEELQSLRSSLGE